MNINIKFTFFIFLSLSGITKSVNQLSIQTYGSGQPQTFQTICSTFLKESAFNQDSFVNLRKKYPDTFKINFDDRNYSDDFYAAVTQQKQQLLKAIQNRNVAEVESFFPVLDSLHRDLPTWVCFLSRTSRKNLFKAIDAKRKNELASWGLTTKAGACINKTLFNVLLKLGFLPATEIYNIVNPLLVTLQTFDSLSDE